MASTTIKVDRTTLIASLEAAYKDKKATLDAAIKAYPAEKKAYEKAIEALKKEALKAARTASVHVNRHYRNEGVEYSIGGRLEGVTWPIEPVDPSVPVYKHNNTRNGEYTGLVVEVAAIEKALKVLKLSTEATVPASYYKSVIDYI